MLIQHFVKGLSDCISGGVRLTESKTLEIEMEKAQIVKENLNFALGHAPSVHTVSGQATGEVVRGSQSQGLGFSRSHPSNFKSRQWSWKKFA